MGRLVVLSDNVFNLLIYPLHTLSSSDTPPAGREIQRIASGRRQRSQNYFTSAAFNTAVWGRSAFNRVRLFDCAFLDRGHNLGGKTVRIQASFDLFATYSERVAVIPTQTVPYSRLSQTNGLRTEEGAWGWRFDPLAGSACRIYVDAMGAGLRPEIVGGYVGQCFRPTNPLIKPFSFGKRQLDYEVIRAPSAWAGAGEISQRKNLELNIRLEDGEYPAGRYHMEELFMRAHPSWIVPDDDQAEKAYLSRAEPQEAGFEVPLGKSQWEGRFMAPEHEPKAA